MQHFFRRFSTLSSSFTTQRQFSTSATTNLSKSLGEFKSTLLSKLKISHDTYIFKFDLPHKELPLGLLPGQHVRLHIYQTIEKKGKIKHDEVSRKYTPVSPKELEGSFDMLIKIYQKTPEFPEGGEMSTLLDVLKIGDEITVTGPSGKTIYEGNGNFALEKNKIKVNDVGFVIGGSGITPAYQIMQEIHRDKDDPTRVHLLYANKTEDDILLRAELEELKKDKRFNFHFTLDKPSTDWTGFQGYVTKEMIQKIFPAPNDKILMTFCGNKPMRKLVFGLFEQLGYNEDLTARF